MGCWRVRENTVKRFTLLLAVLLLALAAYDYGLPHTPSRIIEVQVRALMDAPEGGGWRLIDVALPDGTQMRIKTVTPFFYRAGYNAHVGVYERIFFPDVYDFVAEASTR